MRWSKAAFRRFAIRSWLPHRGGLLNAALAIMMRGVALAHENTVGMLYSLSRCGVCVFWSKSNGPSGASRMAVLNDVE